MSGKVVHLIAEQLNPNDESVIIVEILCEHGSFVKKGAHVLTIETSKAATEICSPADGYIALAGKVGVAIGVGKNVATIYTTLDQLIANHPDVNAEQLAPAGQPVDDAPRATRKALDLARDLGVNLADIPKVGFIREDDVRQFAAQLKKIPDRDRINLSRVKKAAIKTLEISRDTIIPACLLAEFHCPSFAGKKVDVFDLVIYRASHLIERDYADCNAHLDGDAVIRSPRVNFGFMVDVDGDLFMPVIRNAAALSLDEIASTRAESILALFRGERTQEMLAEPTVCASGLNGRHLAFQMPVVYPMTSLIIGVNQRVMTDTHTTPVYLTFAYDHRVLSGFIVSRFAEDLIDSVLQGP